MHPVVRRTLAVRKADGDRSEAPELHQKLLSVDGRQLVVAPASYDHVPVAQPAQPSQRQLQLPLIPEPEVAKRASSKSENLQAMLSKQIDEHVQRTRSSAFDDERWVAIEAISPKGFAELAEKQWDVMTEKHLNPAQKAELLHVRNMIKSLKQQIASLGSSLEGFQRAERELLTNAQVN